MSPENAVPVIIRPETIAAQPFQFVLRYKTALIIALAMGMFAIAMFGIHHELRLYPLAKIEMSIRSIQPIDIVLAIFATAVSFVAISCYDGLSLRYTEKVLPLHKTAMASASAYAVSNTLGFSALTGNAVRYRLYSSWGLNALDVAVVAFVTPIFLFISSLFLVGLGLLSDAVWFEKIFGFPTLAAYAVGTIAVVVTLAVLATLATGPDVRRIRKLEIRKPKPTRVILQSGAALIDWIAAAAVLYLLIPHNAELSFFAFVPIFVAAHYVGAASGLPGGIGVFEAVFLLLVPAGDEVATAAGLVAYRGVYYLLPLIIAVTGLVIHQGFRSKSRLAAGGEIASDFMDALAPTLFGLIAFLVGGVMLVSAAIPELSDNIESISRFVPDSLIEVSHLFASAVGTVLLIVALGLRRRLRNAWKLAIGLLVAGAIFTVFKGGAVSGAAFLILLALCLYFTKNAFYRDGRVVQQRLSIARAAAILSVGGFALWLGFYAHTQQAYSNELWWSFGVAETAPRFLRAGAFSGAILILYLFWRLIVPAPKPNIAETRPIELAKVRAIIAGADNGNAEANLALIGDKQFIFSKSGQSFIMYGVKGRNWVAMGEPVGLESERRELMLAFRQAADEWDAWPSFYSIRGDNLHDFVDLGLIVQKIGEMALVPIEGFSLDGPERKRFRQARNRVERDGCTFEVIHVGVDSEEMENLKTVSDDWLEAHQGTEKGFSLGRFDKGVLSTQPIAVVRKNGRIIAFANLWETPNKSELSLDLMRYTDVNINGLMDFLFAEIMIWGSAQGYRYFSLGMAPLSGLEAERLAPLMTKIGAMVFKYGGKIYGFEGLRAFKQKFKPDWEPVYLAAPSQMLLPKALGNLALLSGGGVLGLLQRDR